MDEQPLATLLLRVVGQVTTLWDYSLLHVVGQLTKLACLEPLVNYCCCLLLEPLVNYCLRCLSLFVVAVLVAAFGAAFGVAFAAFASFGAPRWESYFL